MRSCIVLILKQKEDNIEVYSSLSALVKAHKDDLGISKFTLDRADLEKGYENDFVRIKKCMALSSSDLDKQSRRQRDLQEIAGDLMNRVKL